MEGTPARVRAFTQGHSFSPDPFGLRIVVVAVTRACPWFPFPDLDGKEGVDGSSPSEGSAKTPHVGAFSFRSICSASIVRWVWSRLWSFRVGDRRSQRRRRCAVIGSVRAVDAGFKLLGWNGSAPPDSHLPSVVPGRHHCRWLDHQHNGAAQGMRTVHDAARDRHPLTGAEHERFAPLYLELKPAL